MAELKPCPFCGGRALFASDLLGEHYIVCSTCTCAGPGRESLEEATEAWNRRAKDGV